MREGKYAAIHYDGFRERLKHDDNSVIARVHSPSAIKNTHLCRVCDGAIENENFSVEEKTFRRRSDWVLLEGKPEAAQWVKLLEMRTLFRFRTP